MRQNSLSQIWLFFLIAFSVLSCQKSDQTLVTDGAKENTTGLSVSEAKNWFTANKVSNRPADARKSNTKFDNPIPNWDKAVKAEDRDWYVVEASVDFNKPIGFSAHAVSSENSGQVNSKTSLLVLQHKLTGKIIPALMHIVAALGSDVQKQSYTKRDNFSGIIFYTNLEGEYMNGWAYKNGKVIAKTAPKKASEVARMMEERCTTTIIDWYERECTYYYSGNVTCTEWTYTHSTYYTVCEEDDGGGGGGGGGGYGPSDDAVQDVINLLTDPCKNSALNAITATGVQNAITTFFNDFLVSPSSPLNLTFVETNLNGVPGESYQIPGTNNWQIRLNNNYTFGGQSMSQEAWGVIIAHEILHIAISTIGNSNIQSTYSQHLIIFNNFVTTTQNLLQSAFGLPQSEALLLALNGLGDLWTFGDFDQLSMQLYGVNNAQITNAYINYTVGNQGTRCN
ncbi:MAG: hypothetical protein E6Q24_05570 [Chitinophagaceae bacterium]|nr:MAG: hypothetical protein E6Q24_05570 [Chitinophagaceae bacterium]